MRPFSPRNERCWNFCKVLQVHPRGTKISQGCHREHPRGTKISQGHHRGHPSGARNTWEHPSRVLTLSQRLISNHRHTFESSDVNQECVRCVILKRRAQEFFKATQEVPQRCSRSSSGAPWEHLGNTREIQSGGIGTGAY